MQWQAWEKPEQAAWMRMATWTAETSGCKRGPFGFSTQKRFCAQTIIKKIDCELSIYLCNGGLSVAMQLTDPWSSAVAWMGVHTQIQNHDQTKNWKDHCPHHLCLPRRMRTLSKRSSWSCAVYLSQGLQEAQWGMEGSMWFDSARCKWCSKGGKVMQILPNLEAACRRRFGSTAMSWKTRWIWLGSELSSLTLLRDCHSRNSEGKKAREHSNIKVYVSFHWLAQCHKDWQRGSREFQHPYGIEPLSPAIC